MVGVRQFDETAVLAAVLDVFWRKGWQATSMGDLAAASGVQRGSLYNAYGGKEALFLIAFDDYARRFLAEVEAALAAPSVAEALDRFFSVAIANMTAGDPPRGCLTTKVIVESEVAGAHVRQQLTELLDGLQQMIQSALSARQRRAELVLTPQEAASVLVTFTRGLAVMEILHHDPDRLRTSARALRRALVSR